MPTTAGRFVAFNLVGLLGTVVHLGVLSLLARAGGCHPALASVLAVEAAILHNFLLHERWTWGDRPAPDRLARCLRFHAGNGLVSMAGHALLVPALAGAGLPVEAAGAAVVLLCAGLNFRLADRVVFVGAASLLLATGSPAAAGPRPETLVAWEAYIAAVEAQAGAARPNGTAAPTDAHRQAVLAGGIHVEEMRAAAAGPDRAAVPAGLIHHWRGVVFVPGISLDTLLARVREPRLHRAQPDVLDARVLREDAGSLDLFLKLTRSQYVTATFETEHHVRYVRAGPSRATATSVATRIAEANGRADRGFLWRLNAYWRYEAVAGGVLVECESISLSRGVPWAVRPLVGPAVRSFARESMARTLAALRDALGRA